MSDLETFTIRRATAGEIRLLRHRVLRAGLPVEEGDFEHDNDPETFHAAALTADAIVVGCATIMHSVYEEQPAWRLRGMAIDPEFRRRRLGARLLELCESHAIECGRLSLWCNARTPAVPFYQSVGWQRLGSEFAIPTAGPHYKMTKLILNR